MKANRREAYRDEEIVAIDKYILIVGPVVALRALYELLEDYGPMWYTQGGPRPGMCGPWRVDGAR